MFRVVHLSDIHLNNKAIEDVENFIMPALIEDLKRFNNETQIDLIVFSGDLVDKGGKSFNNIDLAFDAFEKIIINPISEKIEISKNKIFITPGNHDIKIDADEEFVEIGLASFLNNPNKVNNYININSGNGIKRVFPFKNFEKKLYEAYPEKYKLSNFQSCFQLKIRDCLTGVTCFNSAWRCYGSNSDKNNIILGEKQITDARKIIKDCHLKIAIIHHHLNWLASFEQKSLISFIEKDYDLLFCGHEHEGSVWTQTGIYGSLFVSIAPSN